MKSLYPSYYGTKTSYIEDRLNSKDKKLLDNFCQKCRISAGEKKVRVIRATILQLFDILEKPLHSINLKDIQDYLVLLKSAELSPYTKNDIRKFVKKFLMFANEDWSKKFDNFSDFKNVPFKKAFNHQKINENTLVRKEELEKLLRTTQTLKWKAILTFLYETACRPQELRNLKWKNIKFNDEGFADVTLYSNKTEESRTIPIKDCVVHLKRWKQEYQFEEVRDDDYVFPNKQRKQLSDNALPKQLKILCSEAGLRFIHPYLFRHSRLTQLYQKFPEQIIKKYAGHSADSKMTAIYSHISNKDVKDVLLEKLYNVKELSEDEKNKYEIQIEQQDKKLGRHETLIREIIKQNNLLTDKKGVSKWNTLLAEFGEPQLQ